jgi:F-type H+-transporting ATPase subunit delta
MATPRSVKDLARTLIALSAEKGLVPQVLRDLKTVEEALRLDKDLAVDLDETCVALDKRQKAIRDALGDAVDPLVVNTLLALQSRGLLWTFSELHTAAVKEAEITVHHREATVRTATKLTETEKHAVVRRLTERFGGTVELEEEIDPGLIGGIEITIGDWKIDDSVHGKLQRLTQALYV